MNKQQLEAKLEQAWSESGKLRIAIMRAVGRDPYDWPPSDEALIAELVRLTLVPTDKERNDLILRGWSQDESGLWLNTTGATAKTYLQAVSMQIPYRPCPYGVAQIAIYPRPRARLQIAGTQEESKSHDT